MTPSDAISKDLDRQILETHDRFSRAMKARLGTMAPEQKERYFVVLSKLVAKLEERDKPLKQVLQDVMGEILPLVMQELQS